MHTPIAYIDPGAASILLQVIMSAGLGAAIFFRRSLMRAYMWLRQRGSSEESAEARENSSARDGVGAS